MERHLGPVKATSRETMPTLGTVWLEGEVQGTGGGMFSLSVSNSEPTLTLTVTMPSGAEHVEHVDVQPLLERWVHGIVQDRVIQN